MPAPKLTTNSLRVGMALLLTGLALTLHAEPQALTVETEVETEPVSGTVLSVPDTDSAATSEAKPISLPVHGMSMADVERRYGTPKARHPAIGKPPITRWDYDAFSVFFEYRTVLHAVRPDAPAPIQRKDELIGGKTSGSVATPDTSEDMQSETP